MSETPSPEPSPAVPPRTAGPAAAPPAPSRSSPWLKILLGCGLGCGGLLLIGILAVGYGAWWITSSGKQIRTTADFRAIGIRFHIESLDRDGVVMDKDGLVELIPGID